MDELSDKTDGKLCLHSPHIIEQVDLVVWNRKYRVKTREAYIFYTLNFDEVSRDSDKNRDHASRWTFLRLKHCINYKRSHLLHEEHNVSFVLDPKNHNPKLPFHINIAGKSKSIVSNCAKCKKYLSGFDHFPISCDYKKEYGQYKFSNLNVTLREFFKKLKKDKFFAEFKYGNKNFDSLH